MDVLQVYRHFMPPYVHQVPCFEQFFEQEQTANYVSDWQYGTIGESFTKYDYFLAIDLASLLMRHCNMFLFLFWFIQIVSQLSRKCMYVVETK